MLEQKRIAEAEQNYRRYLAEEHLFTNHKTIAQYTQFFLKNAETSLLTAKTLFELSTVKEKQNALGLNNFESYLWVVVSSYYSMFYAALALLAKHNMKVGDYHAHKVVADTLIAQFLKNKKLAKLIESYEENKEAALELVGTEDKAHGLIESFEQERKKRRAWCGRKA